MAGRRILVDKRVIRYDQIQFPEMNFVDVQVKEGSSSIKLANYRLKATATPKKGTVFFIHGMTDYAGRYGFLASKFASMGYDFVCMDQRGHGRSEGMPGYFESIDDLVNDTVTFHEEVMTQSNDDLPCFLFAHSTGCLQAINIASNEQHRQNYAGVSLINPFFAFEDMDEAQRLVALMKTVSFFMKSATVPNFKPAINHNYFYKHWLEDDLVPLQMPMKSHVALFNEIASLHDNLLKPSSSKLL